MSMAVIEKLMQERAEARAEAALIHLSLLDTMKERDAAIARAELAEKANAEAVELLIMVRKIADNWGYLDPGECDHWENQTDNHLRKHKEAGK